MAWSTRSCALWVAAMCLFHVTNLGTAEESVQTLVDDEPLALPGLPRLKGMATAIPVPNAKVGSAVSLGDAHRSGKNYDTPEEEMKALATEDHDANIKSMEMAEHLKATERAKEAEVPEDVTCYHDLVTKAKNQKAMAERLEEEAKDAEERLKSATHLKEETAAAAEKLKRRMERDQKSKTDAEEQYRKEHSTALNAFEAARGNLDNYNNDRKKVDLDSTRSKQVLTKYLEYKKKFIEASANADDPTQSKEVAQYRKLSEQYLTSYHALQAKIQESYTSAQRESDLYQQLSQRYQKIAGDANDIAAEVSKTSADLLKSRKAHKEKQKEYEEHAAEAQKWEQTHAQKKEAAKTANARYAEIDQQAKRSKVNYFKLHALAGKYQEMGEESKRKVELNQVRLFNFEQDIKKTAQEIETCIKSVSLLKRKYETADAAGMVYTKAYRAGGCETAAPKEAAETADLTTEPHAVLASALQLLQQDPEAAEYSAEGCASDKSVATQNLEAAEKAKLAHQAELTHLHVLKEDHATSVSGAKTAKAIMVGSKVKASKYLQVAEHAAEQAKEPCKV